jgi:hypothetical protein
MHSKRLFLSSVYLTAALIAPMAVKATAVPQVISVRVYEGNHKDYHNCDDREDHSYQQFRGGHPKYNATFSKAKHKQQKEYRTWRHAHPDRD